MRKLGLAWMLSMSALVFGACGTDGGGGDDDDAVTPDGGGPGTPDGGGPGTPDANNGDFIVLAQGDWSLPAGAEDYYCIVATIPETIYVGTFRPMIPVGTHHTVVTMYTGNLADGIHPCNAGTGGQRMIYGSGVGSPDFTFPPGVAIKLNAGDRILVNLHLFNSTDGVLNGTSGTLAKTIPADQVQNEAELVLMGPVGFTIPGGGETTINGSCTMDGTVHLIAVAPHMHMLGTYWKATVIKGGQEMPLKEAPYTFDDQTFYYIDPAVDLAAGDKVKTYCTYNNPGMNSVGFGDSSNDEMCFSSVYYWPKRNKAYICPF
jgi:hypothetical protein